MKAIKINLAKEGFETLIKNYEVGCNEFLKDIKEKYNGKIYESVKYTIDHKIAFLKVEYQLRGIITDRGFYHDSDKIETKLKGLSDKEVQKLHRESQRHHLTHDDITKDDMIEAIIDWECARLTKPDKPLNAWDTMKKYFADKEEILTPVFVELGLRKEVC